MELKWRIFKTLCNVICLMILVARRSPQCWTQCRCEQDPHAQDDHLSVSIFFRQVHWKPELPKYWNYYNYSKNRWFSALYSKITQKKWCAPARIANAPQELLRSASFMTGLASFVGRKARGSGIQTSFGIEIRWLRFFEILRLYVIQSSSASTIYNFYCDYSVCNLLKSGHRSKEVIDGKIAELGTFFRYITMS